jgi:hypothetical protein
VEALKTGVQATAEIWCRSGSTITDERQVIADDTDAEARHPLRPPLRSNNVSEELALGVTIRDVTMTQPWPAPPAPVRSRNWLTATLAALAVVLASAALIVALTRSGSGSSPTYTASQKAEAKTQLCERYKLAGHALNIETQPGNDVVLARISMINGGLILETAAADPALDPKYREAARALAQTYQTTAAIGTTGMSTPNQWQAAVDDTNAKDRVMQDLCG